MYYIFAHTQYGVTVDIEYEYDGPDLDSWRVLHAGDDLTEILTTRGYLGMPAWVEAAIQRHGDELRREAREYEAEAIAEARSERFNSEMEAKYGH